MWRAIVEVSGGYGGFQFPSHRTLTTGWNCLNADDDSLPSCLQLGYGAGVLGTDLAITGGPGIGLPGIPGAGNMGNLGLGALGEDPNLLGPGRGMVGLDGGLRQGNIGLNGVAQEPDPLHGGIDMHLPPDAASTLFVDGLPLDCSRREAARILSLTCCHILEWLSLFNVLHAYRSSCDLVLVNVCDS